MRDALWLLIALHLRGWGRSLARNLRTLKGAVLALIGLMVFIPWLLSLALAPMGVGPGMEPETLRRTGPATIVLYCLLSVVFSSSEKAIYFSPAEVNFLFTGPFTRRQLLGYKLALTLLFGLPSMLLMALLVRVKGGWFPASFLGMLLVYAFMQLFSIALSLVATSVGGQAYSWGRKLLLGAVVLGLGVLVMRSGVLAGVTSPQQVVERVADSQAWKAVSAPLAWFFEVMLARSGAALALYFGLGVAVNAALVALIFALDVQYLESSAAASARMYARLQRMRGRNVSGEEAGANSSAWLWLPMPPAFGGVGPLVWRQTMAALRGMGRLVLVLFLLGALLAVPLLSSALEHDEAVFTLGVLGVWLTVFFTALVPFDFRGDIDRLAILKTLPVSPWQLALAQLVVPALLLTLLQELILLGVYLASPGNLQPVLACAILAPPCNFLLIALENLLFLLFPVRLMAATPGDFQALGRNVLLVFAKLLGLGVVALLAGLAALAAALVVGDLWAGVAAAWPVLACSGLALVPLIGRAFQAFDVGRDTPA